MFNVAAWYMLYVRRKHTGCVVSDFPIQAPICLYTMMASMHGNVAESFGICNANALLESKLTKLLATVGVLTHYCTLIFLYSVVFVRQLMK